jgi:RNA recognition motif-containing protein
MATRLYVGNLPPSVTDAQFKEFVTNAGFQMTSARVVREKLTGASWGFGFVDLGEGEDFKRTIAWLNGQALEGHTLTVIAVMPQGTGFARVPDDGGRGRRHIGSPLA